MHQNSQVQSLFYNYGVFRISARKRNITLERLGYLKPKRTTLYLNIEQAIKIVIIHGIQFSYDLYK